MTLPFHGLNLTSGTDHFLSIYSNPGILSCGVPQGSNLGLLTLLMYVNDMAQAVDCDLLLYAGDSCLIFRDKDI